MQIIEITEIIEHNNTVIETTYLFEDDTSVTIDMKDKSISDMDGMFDVPKNKKKEIEKLLNFNL